MNEGNQLLALINRLRAAFVGRDEMAGFYGGLDLSPASTPITMANNTSQAFASINFRGMVMVSEIQYVGGFGVFAVDGSNTVEVVDTIGLYSPTAGNVGTINIYITGSVPTVQNLRGGAATLKIQPLRSS